MRYRCRCLVIHAPTDLRLDEQDAGEIGPGQVLVRVGFGGILLVQAQVGGGVDHEASTAVAHGGRVWGDEIPATVPWSAAVDT